MNVRRLFVPLVLAAATAGWAVQQHQAAGTFPHALHAKLFPTCAGCHSGITSGDTATMFPTKAVCAQCHNGTDEPLVVWTAHNWQPNNLKFSHTAHQAMSSAMGNPAACANCHGLHAGHDTAWMHVAAPSPEACLACHRAPEHLAASAKCTTCHKPLTQVAALSAADIATFPKPPWHNDSNFLAAHAPTSEARGAQCAICHARESCARCHPNADQLPAIQALESDPRVASLTRDRAPVYFTPASHRTSGWVSEHGKDAAANYQTCASCHTQTSCRTCHRGDLGSSTISKLPQAKPGRAPGVVLVLDSTASPSHALTPIQAANTQTMTLLATARDTVHVHMHPPGFATNHKTVAASGLLDCQGCHQPRDCTACHDGVSTRQNYHPADFMSRHAEPAFALEQNCSSCHRVETFCRNCHQKSGIANSGSVRGSAHNGQPLWLLQHGQAARQNLTSCTACHQQSDCLRCHSNLGLHVNPHGPNFNAQLMGSKNMQMCLICHVTNPLNGGG
jgi:hypothetical protein